MNQQTETFLNCCVRRSGVIAWFQAPSFSGLFEMEQQHSPENQGWKTLSGGHCFSTFSTIQGKTMANPLDRKSLRGYTIAVIKPMLQASTCGRVQMRQNNGSHTFMFRVKPLSARYCLWRSLRRRKIESTTILRPFSPRKGSVPQQMAELQHVAPFCSPSRGKRLTVQGLWSI